MESAIYLLRKMPETKAEIKNYVKIVKESVLNGEVEPLRFAANVSALEQLFKALKSDVLIKDVILEEAEKQGLKSFEHGNAKYQIKEVGVKFNFDNCDDAKLDEINDNLKHWTELKKSRENFLKSIDKFGEVYGEDGTRLFAPSKTSTTSVSITIK